MAVTTRLEERYVVKSKLDDLLRSLFGTNFSVAQQGGHIEVTADRELSDDEKQSVTLMR
ncbi:hypothetical protein F5Y10DRAFT_259343 [Nemania abortiva]|nr:hypothetical protein F5Y10DRAFT_259343 [Nemania abortiva]